MRIGIMTGLARRDARCATNGRERRTVLRMFFFRFSTVQQLVIAHYIESCRFFNAAVAMCTDIYRVNARITPNAVFSTRMCPGIFSLSRLLRSSSELSLVCLFSNFFQLLSVMEKEAFSHVAPNCLAEYGLTKLH